MELGIDGCDEPYSHAVIGFLQKSKTTTFLKVFIQL